MGTMKIIVFTDARFSNTRKLPSHPCFVISMADASGRCNVQHHVSGKCHRVTRSGMAAEIHALLLEFDHTFLVRDLLQDLLHCDVPLELYIHSKNFPHVLTKQPKTCKKRKQININALRGSYHHAELAKFSWIPGHSNPTDALTKELHANKASPM